MVFANALITSLLLGVEKDRDARDGIDTIDRHLLRSSGVNLPALASIDRCRLNLFESVSCQATNTCCMPWLSRYY